MSNQEAIALLRNLEDSLDSYCELSEEGKTAFRMAIEALNSSEFPNNSDTISRQAAIDAVRATLLAWSYMPEWRDNKIIKAVERLQPIQPEPKRGRWILDRSGAYCCSECMEPCAGYVMMKPRDKFCKMCGSRNEVTT